MAEFVRPGGDDETFSEEEEEVDILSPPRHANSQSGREEGENRPKPLPVYIPYDPVNIVAGDTRSNALEINKVVNSEGFKELLGDKGISTKLALTASLKYHSSICDSLVSRVVEHRVFKIGSLGLLWFHMLLDDPSAVVPETDVEVVLVRSESDLLSLSPTCRLHRYALVLSSSSLRSGPWRLISLESGLGTAMKRLKALIFVQETAVFEISRLVPGSQNVAGILSPSEAEEYLSITQENWQAYIRNPRLAQGMKGLFGKVVDSIEVLKAAIEKAGKGGEGEVRKGEKVVKFGVVGELVGVKVELELKTGGSPREAELRKLGNVLPFHTFVACLKFPEATSAALPRLRRILTLLISLIFRENECWKACFRILHLKYVREGSSACVLLTANFSSLISFAKAIRRHHAFLHLLSLLDSLWVFPSGQSIYKASLEMVEQADVWMSGRNPKGMRVTQQIEWSDLWKGMNRKEKTFEGCWVQGNSQVEVDAEEANREVGKWLMWLNLAQKVDNSKSHEMALHIFELLQSISTSEDLSIEAYGPGFSFTGQSHISGLSALYELLRQPKKK